ncbi:phosphatase PAP2 family protein [Roseomonas gilardii subsp. gilardii]|uniref:acid phosphatase n=1 Tax=Roseomonas gilardii TaxID=257708 RepID=UPI001FFBED2E|nr:phosphatase PAP2 family protein [Roseomonas gilardii]UPG73792.1 phosphatase PAP2 family protein [Roseomonas gilardii subsp. gilardii]
MRRNNPPIRLMPHRPAASRRALLLASPLLLGLALPAWAEEAPPYVTPRQIDLTVLLPPPPDAAVQRIELDRVVAVQTEASPERIAQAVADAKESLFDMFGGILGGSLDRAALPRAALLFDRVGASEDATVDAAKPFFGRVRPYLADPRVKALVPASKSGSWPSGHTTRVTMSAIVLAAMLPEKRAEIWERARDYAWSRVIGGMHYPSDLEAGQRAGTAMAAILFADPAFQADFAAAKTELRSALRL